MRGRSHSVGALSSERGQLSDRFSGSHRPDGVGAGASHGGALPGPEPLDSRTGAVRYFHISGHVVLHVVHPTPVRHRTGPVLGHHRANRLHEEKDAEESRCPDQRHLAGRIFHIDSTNADHAPSAQEHGRGQSQLRAMQDHARPMVHNILNVWSFLHPPDAHAGFIWPHLQSGQVSDQTNGA